MNIFDFAVNSLGKRKTAILIAVLTILDLLLFSYIFLGSSGALNVYFLDVGQGDAEFITLPGKVDILIDGGPPNGKAVWELQKIMPFYDRYIDLVILTHPQNDHAGGLTEIIKRYKIGAFLYTGRKGKGYALSELEKEINRKQINSIILSAGDKIKYGEAVIDILMPDKTYLKAESINDSSLVARLSYQNKNFLFTGDISSKVEAAILEKFREKIDVIKVAHHGSRFSSSDVFLRVIEPTIAVFEVGKNSYGHPTKEVIDRFRKVGAEIFRTDIKGTIKLEVKDGKIIIFSSK